MSRPHHDPRFLLRAELGAGPTPFSIFIGLVLNDWHVGALFTQLPRYSIFGE